MGVISDRFTQYKIICDECKCGDVCVDGASENVHSKQQAIKWCGMHKIKDGRVLCDKCFKKYKEE